MCDISREEASEGNPKIKRVVLVFFAETKGPRGAGRGGTPPTAMNGKEEMAAAAAADDFRSMSLKRIVLARKAFCC